MFLTCVTVLISALQKEKWNLLEVIIADGVSLIAGMEYEMEWWNGKWNGTVKVHSCS